MVVRLKNEHFSQPQVCVLLLLWVAVAAGAARADTLRSPWDDVHIPLTDAPYDCPAPPPLSKSLEVQGYYSDEHHSVVDPAREAAERKATEAPTHLGQWSTQAADAYLTRGSRAAAQCVYALLDAAAQAKAWTDAMPTSQGSYEQKWLLAGVSVAYLKVRTTGVGTPEQEKVIKRWLRDVAGRVVDYVDGRKAKPDSDAWNNHRYWAGYAVAAAGVAINDGADFQFGVDAFKAGADQIQPDGALPHELARAARALHYHLYALGPLVMMAELAEANGIDLYARDNGAIHRLVRLCEAGLGNPDIFAKATGVPQDVPDTLSGEEIGWAVPWVRRFPDARLSDWIAKARTTAFWQWGGLPPGAVS